MEKVEESADHISKWVQKEMVRYQDWEKKTQQEWGPKKGLERSVLSDRFMDELNAVMKPKEKKESKL
jgi:phage/plasmid-associated DNA primase